MSMCFQAQPLCFERYGPTPGKGIKKFWKIVANTFANLCLCFSEHALVIGILPHHKLFENPE